MIKQNKKMKGGELKMKKDKIKKRENGLKEFFRPELWKIIIFLILVVITFIIFILVASISCDFGGCKYSNLTYFLYNVLFIMEYNIFEKSLPDFILLIFQAIYLYIVACLIYFIIRKIKNVIKK